MKTITRVLAYIGGLVVLVAVIGWAQVLFNGGPPKLGKQVVLTLDVTDVLEGSKKNGGLLSQILPREDGATAIVRTLDRARRDERVLGLVARFGETEPPLAIAQEVRAAIQRFKAAGKFTIAYAPSFGEAADATKSYYLASTFAEVWVQPVGLIGLNGLSFETPFLRGLLDRYGLKPEFVTRKAYKTAAANLTDTAMSPANRTMMTSLLDDLSQQLITGIAENRGLPVAAVDKLFGSGPINTRQALAQKLIDRAGYQDELLEYLQQKAGKQARLTALLDYAAASDTDLPDNLAKITPDEHKRIAVINLRGPIHLGESVRIPSRQSAGADTITSAIATAAHDKNIKAIVLRIDSPGGSPAASETIRRALILAEKGHDTDAAKPVIVSMGTVAASGGYWVASGAKYIVANPATLTGSIGVVIGKVSAERLSRDFGINWDGVSKGAMANILSPAHGFSQAERATIDSMADDIYGDFINRVAEARHMTPQAVETLAQGRVWTGAQAHNLKLVDELGGLDTAINRAKEMIGLTADTPVYIDTLPHPQTRLERLMDLVDYYKDLATRAPAMGAAIESAVNPGLVEAPPLRF